LIAVTKRSPETAARAEAIRQQEEMLDRAVEELLRWTASGTVVPLTASKDMTVALEAAMVVKGCRHAPGIRSPSSAVKRSRPQRCRPRWRGTGLNAASHQRIAGMSMPVTIPKGALYRRYRVVTRPRRAAVTHRCYSEPRNQFQGAKTR
jgi:hypothetical protein